MNICMCMLPPLCISVGRHSLLVLLLYEQQAVLDGSLGGTRGKLSEDRVTRLLKADQPHSLLLHLTRQPLRTERGRWTGDRGQRTEDRDRGQGTEDRGKWAWDRGQKTETEDRTEDRGQRQRTWQGTKTRGQRGQRGQRAEDREDRTEDREDRGQRGQRG